MNRSIIKTFVLGIVFSIGFFLTAFVFIKAASLIATSGTPLTAGNWNDMVKNFFWGSGSGGIYYNGKVGIGINSPNKALHVYNTTNNAEIDLQSVSGDGKHWAIYQDATTQELRLWNEYDRFKLTTGGNLNVQGVCINGDCKTAWSQVSGGGFLNYTGTCDSAHKGATGIISNIYKLCNGSSWTSIVPASNYFAGAGTSADPYRLNGESASSTNVTAPNCNYYNLNAVTLNNGTTRYSGTCGAGTSACLTSGIYRINPSGSNSYNVYCDMTTNSGGWTMVVRAGNNGDTALNTNSSYNLPVLPTGNSAKISHADIQLLVNGSSFVNPVKIEFPEAGVSRYIRRACTWTSSTSRNLCASWATDRTTTTHYTHCGSADNPSLNNGNGGEWPSSSITWPYQDGTCQVNGGFSTTANGCAGGNGDSFCLSSAWSASTGVSTGGRYKVNMRIK